jgi:hypothetical protein
MRLRFTIRDLLWLTALVALAVGWWLDHSQQAQRISALKKSQAVSSFLAQKERSQLQIQSLLRFRLNELQAYQK